MIRTLLLLILCAYGTACHADATLSTIAPDQKSHTIKTQPRIVKPVQKKIALQRKAAKPPATFTMKTKQTTLATKPGVVRRPPVISYKPATKQQLHTAQEKLQQQQADRIQHSKFSHALMIYADPKTSIQQKSHAASEMVDRMKQVKTPEKQALIKKQLQRYNLSQSSLQQEATSGKALTRIQEHAAKKIKPGQDLKSDPTIAAEYKKLNSYHKALADRHLATIHKTQN